MSCIWIFFSARIPLLLGNLENDWFLIWGASRQSAEGSYYGKYGMVIKLRCFLPLPREAVAYTPKALVSLTASWSKDGDVGAGIGETVLGWAVRVMGAFLAISMTTIDLWYSKYVKSCLCDIFKKKLQTTCTTRHGIANPPISILGGVTTAPSQA